MTLRVRGRGQTRQAVYGFVRAEEAATKNSIAAGLNLSLPTVTKYLSHLMASGLIEQDGKLPAGEQGGRSPLTYTCVPNGRVAVGVDVTSDTVTCLVVNLERDVLYRRAVSRAFSPTSDYFAFVGDFVEKVIADARVSHDRVLGIGVAVPGLVSVATERVTYGRVIRNEGVAATDFGANLSYPTRLIHDSYAAGRAEFWGDPGYDNAVYISLSKSVGGSVLLGGEIYQGDGEFSGEVGHLIIRPGGTTCYCGLRGCADGYCNATVLAREAGGSLTSFFHRLDAGDPAMAVVWDRYTEDLALTITNARVLFGCKVIVGGDVGARMGEPHLEALRRKVEALEFRGSSDEFVVSCDYKDNPIATGAALCLVDDFLKQL